MPYQFISCQPMNRAVKEIVRKRKRERERKWKREREKEEERDSETIFFYQN